MTCLTMPLDVELEGQPTVPGGELKSINLRLQQAEWLLLTAIPQGDAAKALVSVLADIVARQEARKRPRGPKERRDLYDAVGAVAGGVLNPALRHGRMVHISRREGDYAGGLIGYSAIKVTLDGLTAAGFLQHHSSKRFVRQVPFGEEDEWAGLHSRYEATPDLLAHAASHGITPETVRTQFGVRYFTEAEAPERSVTLKGFKTGKGLSSDALIAVSLRDTTYRRFRAEVALANQTLAAAKWTNCQPPRVFRTFRGDWAHGGRWITTGKPPLQHISRDARLDILINGIAVAEVDVRGSQLAIAAAMSGCVSLAGRDPYQLGPLAAFPRDEVKDAVVAALGSGKLRTTWPKTMGHRQHNSMAALSEALAAVHPYLAELAALLGVKPNRVSLRLQAVEAECLTGALLPLWRAGVPAVPVHDSVIIPAAAAEVADAALRESYKAVTGAVVTTTVRRAEKA